jgi:hypothetical protein
MRVPLLKLQLVAKTLLLVLIYAALTYNDAFAGTPMPYTDEALIRLNSAMEKIKPPADISGDDDLKVKTYIKTYTEIFAAAGYDYERSIIKIINDIQFERYKLNRATIKLNGLARELLRMHVKTGIPPGKYLSKDCAELLIEFRNLIRSNMKKYGGC